MRKIDLVVSCCQTCPFMRLGKLGNDLHGTVFCYCSAKCDPLQFSESAQKTMSNTLGWIIPDIGSVPYFCPLPPLGESVEVE